MPDPAPPEALSAIADLVARYNWAVDHLDAQDWAATFTEDGALLVDGQTRASGRAALTAYIARRSSTGTRHWTGPLLIDPNDGGFRLRCYVMAFRTGSDLTAPYVMGEYDDEIAVTPEGYRFRRRHMHVVAGASATARFATTTTTTAPD